MVKLKFVVSRLANQFFFISNLAEWHFSCRREYNNKWLERTGELSGEEEKSLRHFGKLMRKRGFSDKYIGRVFYTADEKKVWRKLRGFVSKEEFALIERVFLTLSARWNRVWKELRTADCRKRIDIFRSELRLRKNRSAMSALENLFLTGNSREVKVLVLFPPAGVGGTTAGSANIDHDAITFELPQLKKGTLEFDLSVGIFFHELAHIFFEKINGKEMISGALRKFNLPRKLTSNCPMTTFSFVNEVIASSLAPTGYLTLRFYGAKFRNSILSRANTRRLRRAYRDFKRGIANKPNALIKYFAWKSLSLAEEYVREKKKIDQSFVDKIYSLIKDRTP